MNHDAMSEKHEARERTHDPASLLDPIDRPAERRAWSGDRGGAVPLTSGHGADRQVCRLPGALLCAGSMRDHEPARARSVCREVHQLVATHICPSSRTKKATAAAVTMACALIPESPYTSLRNLVHRCASCDQSDSCPLESEAELRPFRSI